jgi:hypothetical protein
MGELVCEARGYPKERIKHALRADLHLGFTSPLDISMDRCALARGREREREGEGEREGEREREGRGGGERVERERAGRKER